MVPQGFGHTTADFNCTEIWDLSKRDLITGHMNLAPTRCHKLTFNMELPQKFFTEISKLPPSEFALVDTELLRLGNYYSGYQREAVDEALLLDSNKAKRTGKLNTSLSVYLLKVRPNWIVELKGDGAKLFNYMRFTEDDWIPLMNWGTIVNQVQALMDRKIHPSVSAKVLIMDDQVVDDRALAEKVAREKKISLGATKATSMQDAGKTVAVLEAEKKRENEGPSFMPMLVLGAVALAAMTFRR